MMLPDRVQVELRAQTTKQRDLFRAGIILLAQEGRSTWSIAREPETVRPTVSTGCGRFARAHKTDLAARKRCQSSDPELVAKAGDMVALFMAPPENAIVIRADEKPPIQTPERAQGDVKLCRRTGPCAA